MEEKSSTWTYVIIIVIIVGIIIGIIFYCIKKKNVNESQKKKGEV